MWFIYTKTYMMHLNSENSGYLVPGDKSAVMHHAALQLEFHP